MRVQRVSLDANFTCPNVDGRVATGGCVFCDNRSFSPSRRSSRRPLSVQLDEGIRQLKLRYRCDHFLAYFQPATNTYAPPEQLSKLFSEVITDPRVVGLVIGTRPDCVPPDVLDLIEEFSRRTYVSLEYGMQTMHDRSLAWMNRGHGHDAFVDAVERSQGRNFEIGAHVILGLPGESREDMRATAEELARLKVDAVKIHNLYAVKETPLAKEVLAGHIRLIDRASYVQILVDFLERLPPYCVVERLSGDAPPDFLVGPNWCLDKPALRSAVDQEFQRRDTWQAKRYRHRPKSA